MINYIYLKAGSAPSDGGIVPTKLLRVSSLMKNTRLIEITQK